MTEPRRSAREWRLYAITAIAGVYVLAWSRISPAPEVAAATPAARVLWLDELSPAARPVVSPPAGWHVADRHEVAAPIPRRVPVTGAPRIRTRSS